MAEHVCSASHEAWHGIFGMVSYGRYGMVWYSKVWYGMVWCVRFGMVRDIYIV